MTRAPVVTLWLAGVALVAFGISTAIFHTEPGTDIWLPSREPVNCAGPEMTSTSSPSAAMDRQ